MMSGWDGVVAAAALATLLATGLRILALRRSDAASFVPWADRMTWLAAGLAALAFVWLVGRFLAADVSIEYVFLYTSTSVDWPYRIAGAWTGREGSLLLWATWLVLVAAVYGARSTQRSDAAPSRPLTAAILTATSGVFLAVAAAQGTFSPTDPFFLGGRPGGNGLNPTLMSPYILIHPPLMFLAYALTAVPVAAGVAHLLRGQGGWSRDATAASHWNWVLYTFAMGLGGLWAYYTLGFGGYWAWDPVETANFLPWLALTVYLHAQRHHAKHGGFALAGPLLAALPFLLTLLSTVSTRSGLWVSVHAFTDPTQTFDPDAAGRLLGILDADPSLAPYIALLVGGSLLILALWARRVGLDLGVLARTSRVTAAVLAAAAGWAALSPTTFLAASFEAGARLTGGDAGLGVLILGLVAVLVAAAPVLVASDDSSGRPRITTRFFLASSVVLLGLALVVATLWHMATVNGWDRAFWEARVPWIVTPIAFMLIWFSLRPRSHKGALAVAGVVVVGAGTAFLVGGLAAYALLLAIATFAAVLDRFWRVAFPRPATGRAAAIALWSAAILDVVWWTGPAFSPWLDWRPQWPLHVLVIPSLVAVWGAHRAAHDASLRWPYILTGLLGGYLVALPLAALAWFLARRHAGTAPDAQSPGPARILVGVYGLHLMVGILFVGYAASTYYDDDVRAELMVDGTTMLGGHELRFNGVASMVAAPGGADRVEPAIAVDGIAAEGIMYWEPRSGSYFPLPSVLRLVGGDVYFALEAVCIGDPCKWHAVFEDPGRIAADAEVRGVRFEATWLPAVNLVWASLALFVAYGTALAWVPFQADRPGTTSRGSS